MGDYPSPWTIVGFLFAIVACTAQTVEWIGRPLSTSVREGENVTFVCRLNIDDPYLIWSKDSAGPGNMSILFVKSERFDASSRVYIANKYDLVITNVKREDNGMYACRTKDAGIQTATLTVLLPPGTTSITRDDISPVYTEGKVVKFKCSSSGGNPPPTIIWLKNGNISTEIPEYKASTELAGVSSSTITVKLDKTDHQANYSCLVYNEVNVNNKLLDYVVLNVKYSPSIAFQPYSPVYFVKMGVNIEIFCDVDANPAVSSVTWSKDGIGLSGTSPRRVLSPVTKSDNGTYTCTAKNSIGEHSGSFDINVQYAPNLSAQPTLTANEGDSVTLNCMIDANPKPFEVVWSKMSPNGSLQNKVTSSTFKIATVSRTDAGNYSCRAQSQLRISGENVEFVTSEVFTYLYVQYKPGKASLGPVPDLDVGDRLEILCTATPNGYPEPVYTWMKDGQTLPQNRQTFVISSVKLTDNGRYSCTPSNNRGRGDPAFVDVNIFEPPTIIRKPEVELSVFLSEPNLLSLTCEVRGYPQPRVNWYQEGETQSLNTRPDLFTVITTNRPGDGLSSRVESILQFKGNSRTLVTSSGQRIGLQIRDMGNYSCQADSDKHTDTPTTNTRVYINFPPVLEASPKILAASKMERAELSCTGQGYPEPSIQWSSQGQVLTLQPAVLSVTQQTLSSVGRLESKLSILNVTDKSYGTYKCTLRNALGNASQEIVLTNKSPPEQPLNVTAGSITWESVMLTWVPGFDGGMSQRFFIQFYTTGTSFGSSQKLEVLPTSSRYFNVTKLHPSKTYTFQVVAENDLGFGPASLPVVVTTSSLLIPSLNKIPVFDSRSRKLVVVSTYDNNYCLKVEVKTSRTDWTQTHGCMMVMGGTMEVSNVDVTAINVTVCLSQRPEVCGLPVTAEFKSSNEAQLTEEHVIIIACVCGVIIVTLLIILFCFIFRRRRNAAKSYQSGNQGEPPPYNAVPPSKKPQGFDNQGMDTSDLQQTPSPSPSVHAITTSYTNSSYPNRMESFQARDNPVPVTRSNTKDKYIDLHDRGSDPMMGPDTPGYNGALDQGSNAKPKKAVKKKWRWQWKKKELPPVPSPQFAHTPPGHTCSLPCCNHDQDDLEVTKPVSHSQRGCVPVPLVNGPDFSNNNFFMKKISGLCDEPFADGWESRSLSDSQSEGRNILRLKKHAKAASPKHGAVTLTTLRRRKQLAPWEQIRSRQISLPGSLKPHRVTFLNFQPGESSDCQEVTPSSDKSSFSSAVAFIQNSKKDEHSQQASSLQTFVQKTANEIHENSTSSSSEAGADLGGKRRLNSQLPPVPSVENNSAEVDSLGDVRSLLDEHLYDVPSDLMYSQESEKVTKILSVSLPHIPSIPLNDGLDGNMTDIDNNSFHGSTSDSVNIHGSVNDSSNYHGSISDSANYHGSVSGSHTSSYVYNGSLVSLESCDPLYSFRKSNYFPPIRRPKRIPVLMDKNVDTLGHRDGNMLLYTDKSYSQHDIRQLDQHVSGHLLNRRNKIKLWDLKSMSVNSEPNIYSTFPLRRPVTALWTTGPFNQRSRHRHYSDVSSNQICQMFKTLERGQYLEDHSITMNDLCTVTSSNREDLPNMTVLFRPANKSNTISDFSQRHGHTQHLDLSGLKLCLSQVSSESPKVQGIGSTLRTNTVDRSKTKSWSFPGNEAQRFLWTENNIVNWRLQAEHFKDTNFITLIL